MKVAVCVKQVPDTEARIKIGPDGKAISEADLNWIVSPYDELAIEEALARTGLAGYLHTPAQRLSAGQKRRIALARLLLSPATLWILDEPYDALDSDGIEAVNALLAEHLARGGSVLLTSHQAAGATAPPMASFDLDPFA